MRVLLATPAIDEERSLLDGSELLGDMNCRTDHFDCGTDPGGFYEEDL